MEQEGLISRVIISNRPIQTEYSVTEKGKMIEPILEKLAEFSMKYEPEVNIQRRKTTGYGRTFRS